VEVVRLAALLFCTTGAVPEAARSTWGTGALLAVDATPVCPATTVGVMRRFEFTSGLEWFAAGLTAVPATGELVTVAVVAPVTAMVGVPVDPVGIPRVVVVPVALVVATLLAAGWVVPTYLGASFA
jgi:hypothetical protein